MKQIDTDKRTNEHASEYERNNRILLCCKNFLKVTLGQFVCFFFQSS